MNLNTLRQSSTVILGESPYFVRVVGRRLWNHMPDCLGFAPAPNKQIRAQRFPYRTRLYEIDRLVCDPVFARKWHVDFRQVFCAFENEDRLGLDVMRGTSRTTAIKNHPRHYGIGHPEALIFAPSEGLANDVLTHINAAMLLFNGYAPFEADDILAHPDKYCSLSYPAGDHSTQPRSSAVTTAGVYHSCCYVARIWENEHARLALARLSHAARIIYHHWMDASPRINLFADFDRTTFLFTAYALAITSAFSAIEELRLEPRHRHGEHVLKDGQWNERITAELRERLSAAGVDPDEEVVWIARGAPTLVERRVAPPSGKRASWARWKVRDRLVPLTEAVLLSARIRHRASSHATKSETRALTPVDLLNVHATCRALLLGVAGMSIPTWRDEPETRLEFAQLSRRGFKPPEGVDF
ncbi:hypothetical protein [Brevundimonas sp.]|uniref:hypothetical protein n=1 Tax=Brevundimonas sp. TaxID=1871086 RepID=UPI0026086ED2|nr:hypothetical protein [Brevundimonas sp.]